MDAVLHHAAPWNSELHDDSTRYAQVYDRKYTVGHDGVWFVWAVDNDGFPRNAAGEHDPTMFVAIAFTLAHARIAIDLHGAGWKETEIREHLATVPRVGTGRNHPRNVERRRRR